MNRRISIAVILALVATSTAWTWQLDPAQCKTSGSFTRLSGLPEASGLAVSTQTPGRLWALNDSGKAEIVAIDSKGKAAGRVAISGATVHDWEAIAAAPCGNGSCLYIADIGDNDAKRKAVTIYRVLEPSNPSGSVKADAVFHASYPDGAHDAEALLAAPDGALYIVTKGDVGTIALYRFPRDLKSGSAMKLERVGEPLSKGQPAASDRVTDGAISADGHWVALRTKTSVAFYKAAGFLKGNFRETKRVDLKPLGEPQGEAVAFGPTNTVFVAGEGGGKSQPGTLASLSCGVLP